MQTNQSHPTPDQRRAEAIAQATAVFDGQEWPRHATDADAGLGFEATQPIHRVDLIAERHAELIETLRWEGNEARKTIAGAMVALGVFITIVLLVFFLTAGKAHAQQTHLLIHKLSYHIDRSQDRNEVNPGLGVQYRPYSQGVPSLRPNADSAAPLAERALTSGYVQAGFYKNSYRRDTVYFAAGSEPLIFGPINMGAFIAIGTGYANRTVTEQRIAPPAVPQLCPGKPCPLPAPQTITTVRTKPTNALRAAAGISASLQGQRFGVHLVAMPPLQVNGQKLSTGVFAVSLSARI